MTNTEILKRLYDIAATLKDGEKKAFEMYRNRPELFEEAKVIKSTCTGLLLAGFIAAIQDDERRAEAKKSGNGTRLKAAERIIKNAKSYFPYNPGLHGAQIDENGKQIFSDGYAAFRLEAPLQISPIPANVPPVNVSRLIVPNGGTPTELPDIPTLKAHIKSEKARKAAAKDKKPVIWDFGEKLPQVNAEYLLNVLEILPGCTMYAVKKNDPLYFESADGAAVLMPIYRK